MISEGTVADFDPGLHDALMLVHPTYAPEHSTDQYVHSLAAAIERARGADRPVFYCLERGEDERITRHLDGPHAIETPLYLGWCYRVKRKYARRRAQREVDFIAGQIGKDPSEIRLGFGGMYAEGCVHSFATTWCRKIATKWPEMDDDSFKWRPKRPLAQGDVLERLVISSY